MFVRQGVLLLSRFGLPVHSCRTRSASVACVNVNLEKDEE